jgi:transaldolase/glucose-6-phosphate isomerase
VVLFAMRGNSLFAEVCRDTFGVAPGWPQLLVLDNTDPAAIREVEACVDPAKTLFIIASKSETTAESLTRFRDIHDRLTPQIAGNTGEHVVAITDPGTPLAAEVRRQGFRYRFENPADIGGRHSALSYFGLVPMALLGIDITTLLERAHQMWVSCGPFIPAEANPGVSLGTLLALAARQGRNQVTFVSAKSLDAFGNWAAQLLAASTGKAGLGLVPVVQHEALSPPNAYRANRVFVSLRLEKDEDAAREKHLAALEQAGHPVVRITMNGVIDLGAECFRWEVAAATAGAIMGANAF